MPYPETPRVRPSHSETPLLKPVDRKEDEGQDGCPRFAKAYLGRKRQGQSPHHCFQLPHRKTSQREGGFLHNHHKSNRRASPGFPVEIGCVGAPHAAFLTESRTREPVWRRLQEIRVAPSFSAQVRWGEPGHPSSSSPIQFLLGSAWQQTPPE